MILVLILALALMAFALAQLADAHRRDYPRNRPEGHDVWLSRNRSERRWRP